MEAGVRRLKNRLDTLCRVAAVKLVGGEMNSVSVEPGDLREMLETAPIRHDRVLEAKAPGIGHRALPVPRGRRDPVYRIAVYQG